MSPKKPQPRRRKHQPQRTCIACRDVEGKRRLLRVVRTPTGQVELDPSGKKSGRGAYVHTTSDCIRRAVSGGALARALKIEIDPDTRQRIANELATSIGEEPA